MTKHTLFYPLGNEHKLYESVSSGKKNIVVNLDRVKELCEDGETPEGIARDMYAIDLEANKNASGPFRNIVTNEPVFDEKVGFWVVRKTLSEDGQKALAALDLGILWDPETNDVNYSETVDYYDKMIDNGRIEMRFVDLIIQNTHPELKGLKSRLVYFKMQGQKSGNAIVNL